MQQGCKNFTTKKIDVKVLVEMNLTDFANDRTTTKKSPYHDVNEYDQTLNLDDQSMHQLLTDETEKESDLKIKQERVNVTFNWRFRRAKPLPNEKSYTDTVK